MTKPQEHLLWRPTSEQICATRLAQFMAVCGHAGADYDTFWRWSVDHMEDFWRRAWDDMGVIGEKGETVLKDADKMPGAHFFPAGKINYAENLLKVRGSDPAIIFMDETGKERVLSRDELYDQVSRWQQAMMSAGVGQGDRVAALMPNMPETIIACLAAASLGAIWSSASPDFGVQGVIDRFGQIEPKILIAVDGYYYGGKTIDCLTKLRDIQPALPGLTKTIIVPFVTAAPDISGLKNVVSAADFIKPHAPRDVAFSRVPFNHPLFIMFSSGTTGIPKCIVHGHGGTLIQHMKEHQFQCDIHPGDRVFYFTTCGWMMWNWLVTALASGATLLLFDGNPAYPDFKTLWDFTSRHRCKLFGTSAKYIDAMKVAGFKPKDHVALDDLRIITSTGSPLVHESFDFVYGAIKKDVHLASISGGTDIISCFVIGNPLSPVYRGEIQGAGLGYAIDVFDDNGKPLPPGAGSGELVCVKPFPSMPVMFWHDEDGSRYKKAYFENYPNIWCHGDWIERTAQGGFIILGRSDATLNPGGVRIGTAEIYRQVEQIPDVVESIAVGQDWEGDVRIILFVRLKPGATLTDDLKDRIRKQIRTGASPRHVPAKILEVADIPRTKSGKITELAVRDVIHGRKVKNVEALANPQALDLYREIKTLHE
jgi:acetoacetyl-CoA synthetase